MKTNNIEPQITSHAPHATSNIFSFRRFGRYASAELRASRHFLTTIVWLTAAIYVGLVLVILLFNETLADSCFKTYRILTFGAVITSAVLISSAFKRYHNSMTAPAMIMLPASSFEKFTHHTLYYVALIPAIIFADLYLVDALVGTLTPEVIDHSFEMMVNGPIGGDGASNFITFVLLASFFFLGAALFRRAQFVLNSVSFLVLLIIFTAIIARCIYTQLPDPQQDLAQFEAMVKSINSTINIIFYCMIPVTLFFAWLRFRSLQLKK